MKLGLGLDLEQKKDIYVRGIRKNSSSPDLSEPAQNTQELVKNFNRKRTFTEGNVILSPERDPQDESLIRSELNFKEQSPKKKKGTGAEIDLWEIFFWVLALIITWYKFKK